MLKPIIFGLVGGVLGLLIGAFWLAMLGSGPTEIVSSGGVVFRTIDGNWFVGSIFAGAIASIVGALLVRKSPVIAGLLMLASALPTALLFGFHFVTAVTGLPSMIGGVTAIWAARPR